MIALHFSQFSLSIEARFYTHALRACYSPKRCSAPNTHSNDFIRRYNERVTSRKRKNRFVSHCEGCESGVACEGRVVGVPKFHSWGKCTMPLTNINSDWMSNASSGLCINLHYLYYLRGSFLSHLGV